MPGPGHRNEATGDLESEHQPGDGGETVFEQHKEHKELEAHDARVRDWQAHHDAYVELIDTARTFEGTSADGILLEPGETVFLQVSDSELIEERRGPGTYSGRSQGISVPVMKVAGRQIRYRVGASKGHFVQGDPAPKAIDTGTLFITSTRVVFRGSAQTRECAFAKLIGFDHDADTGTTNLSVSNRSKPTTIHYGPACAATVEFRFDLALAHFRHTVDALVAGLEADLATIDAARPDSAAPSGVAPAVDLIPPAAPAPVVDPNPPVAPDSPASTPTPARVAPVPAPAIQPVAAGWFPDPWGAAPLRWWDGATWGWQTTGPAGPPVAGG